jgi:hypothetical protein
MKRYTATVWSDIDFVTMDTTGAKLTRFETEFLVKTKDELYQQLHAFLTKCQPFYGLDSGLDKDQIDSKIAERKEFRKILDEFDHRDSLWAGDDFTVSTTDGIYCLCVMHTQDVPAL